MFARGLAWLGDQSTLTLMSCAVLGNSGNGILVTNRGTINLGDGVGSLGGNTLQSPDPARRNQGAGVCTAVANVSARSDHGSQCPPRQVQGDTACQGGIDIGVVLQATVNAASCLSP
jgi:hypothetical protein